MVGVGAHHLFHPHSPSPLCASCLLGLVMLKPVKVICCFCPLRKLNILLNTSTEPDYQLCVSAGHLFNQSGFLSEKHSLLSLQDDKKNRFITKVNVVISVE